MRKLRMALVAAVGIAACAVPTVASASVTFAPTTGIGFVGKGDVQLALGLNNAQMQAQAGSLTFTYVKTDTYEVVNAWATGNPDNPVSLSSHTETVTTTVGVNDTVSYDARTMRQVTGFNLTGFGSQVVSGTIPVVSPTVTYVTYTWTDNKGVVHTTDQLPADPNGNLYTEGDNKAVLSVTLISSTGGLFVNGVALS